MSRFTYSNQNPNIIAAGERLRAEEDRKFEIAKNTPHIFAFNQSFYDFIGHHKNYIKEIFVELKKQTFPTEIYKVSENFHPSLQFVAKVESIRPMTKYAEIEIGIYLHDTRQQQYTIKVKYLEYFKMKKDMNQKLLEIIDWHDLPNNYLQNDARKDIWKFDFSKIDFLANHKSIF